MTTLQITGLDVTIGRRSILSDIDLTVMPGEFVGIIGPNGAGKTTLLKAVCGLTPSRGGIMIGEDALVALAPAERARRVAYLPQGHTFYWPLPAAEIVALGRLPRGAGADLSAADREAVSLAMAATGTTQYARQSVTTLSGGERARIALARVLATEAPLILADEPTASLDPRYQLIVLDVLKAQAQVGGNVIAVLHDLGLAARYADRLVVLDQGRIVADGTPSEVLSKTLLAETFGVEAMVVDAGGIPVVIPWAVSETP